MKKSAQEPRVGWYNVGDWMHAFRPDGVGRVGVNNVVVAEFTEIVCDFCNAEIARCPGCDGAGLIDAKPCDVCNGHGKHGRVYFDGGNSLCESCAPGAK